MERSESLSDKVGFETIEEQQNTLASPSNTKSPDDGRKTIFILNFLIVSFLKRPIFNLFFL